MLDDHHLPAARASTTPTATGCSSGSRAARPAGRRATAAASGLYVSRALMRGMDGELSLDPPEPGRGAPFRLTLPGEPPPTEAGDP